MSVKTDTKILTNQGLKLIQNITTTDLVLSKFGWVNVKSNMLNNKECVELVDDYEFSLILSKDTKINIVRNEQHKIIQTFDIDLDDYITLLPGESYYSESPKLEYTQYVKNTWGNKSNRLKEDVIFPDIISENLAYFLGYSYGDGYIEKSKGKMTGVSLACSDDYQEIKNNLREIITQEFNVDVKINKGDGALENVEFFSVSILNNLFKNGILKQNAGSLIFPEKILYADTKIQMSFFSGFFDADGCAQKSKKSYRIDSIDFNFMKNFQLICFSNGIIGRISYNTRNHENKNWHDIARYGVVGAASIKKMKEICHKSFKISTANFINTRDSVLTIYKSKDFNIPYNKYNYVNNVDYISYEAYRKLQTTTNLINHKPLLKSKLSNIDDVGVCNVYDLIVDGDGYWANGYYILM